MAFTRYMMTLSYRGSRYHGWQRQLAANTWKGPTPEPGFGIPTIQETVARALGGVLGHPVTLVGSSRTDSGVHAKGQVAHFDTDQTQIPPLGMQRATNHQLPADILIRDIEPVDDRFDAILSTECKRYQYAVWATDLRNPFIDELVWHQWRPLDDVAMAAAATHFVGTRDFTSFARPGHKRGTAIRTVMACDVHRRGPLLVIGVTGSGFLWNMVRIIAGTLMEVGLGLFTPDDIPRMLEARDRRRAGSTAPAQGLYLQWIRLKRAGAPIAAANPQAASAGDTPSGPLVSTAPNAPLDCDDETA
jgi:tRNA pseudouridine38-40 synthase